MYRIRKEFHFSASHQLTSLPADHPCARLHGHNYIVVVELAGTTLNEHGFIRDYRTLTPIKNYIDDHLDHQHLNDIFKHDQITAEFLAKHFFDHFKPLFPEISAVLVSETPKTWAEYRP